MGCFKIFISKNQRTEIRDVVSPKIAHGVNGRVRRQVHTQPDSHGPQVLIKTTIKLAARSIWQAVIVILGGIWTKASRALLLHLSTRMSLKKADGWRADCVRKIYLPCPRHHHLAGTAGKLQGQRKGKFTLSWPPILSLMVPQVFP